MTRLHDRPSDEQLAWLREHAPEPAGRDDEGTARARTALLAHIDTAETEPQATRAVPARSRATSGRWARRFVAVGAVATVAGVVVTNLPQGDRGVADAAVIRQIRAAAEGITEQNRILYSRSADGNEYWSLFDKHGGSIQRTRLIGTPPLDGYTTTRLRGDRWHFRYVTWNLENRTWSTHANSNPGPTAEDRAGWAKVEADPARASMGSSSQTIVKALSRGEITVVTRGRYRGTPAIRIKLAPFEGFDQLLWVDAKTYLPLQRTEYKNGKEVGQDWWLPVTALNRELLEPDVPAGYKKLDSEAFSDLVNFRQ